MKPSRWANVALVVTTLLGAAAVLAACWEAAGPFTVRAGGHSLGCGSPFLGRNIGGHPGGEVTAADMVSQCLRESIERRRLTYLLAGLGLGVLVVVLAAARIRLGGHRAQGSAGVRRGAVVVGAGAAVLALVLLAGGTWAVARVPKGPSSPPTTSPTPTTRAG